MPRDLLELRAVDDQFRLEESHRQDAADVPPGHRVAVALPGHQPLGRHVPVDHRRHFVGMGRQREEVRHFEGMPVQGALLRLVENASDILPDYSQLHKLYAPEKHYDDQKRG